MPHLSVNINKIATLRNSRGGDVPDVVQAAKAIQEFGADGITVHPRPDERHIRYQDVRDLRQIVYTEFNIEGNPREDKFVQLVLDVLPEQVTLVPDAPGQLTSNHGWRVDKAEERAYLREILSVFRKAGIRTSIFLDPVSEWVPYAKESGTDRIELYTEAYASGFFFDKEASVAPYIATAKAAWQVGLGINAGHDLNLKNLGYFAQSIQCLNEVSIGHALISDALYLGLENVVQLYKRALHTQPTILESTSY